MSMREKIADLLARQDGYTSLLSMPAGQRDNWRNRADAVLDALMEPSEGMYHAAFEELVPVMDSQAAWRSVIQAARDGK